VAVVTAAMLFASGSGPEVVLTIHDPELIESSGLAVSARHPDVLWTHNDGGQTAEVIAVDANGDTVAHVTLAGIDPYDAEALAPGKDAGGRPALYLGDIGDNLAARPDVSVFRFSEPATLTDATVPAQWYRFSYPDGAHDAEALLVGPTGRIMIASKELLGGALYRAPRRLVTADQGTNRLTRVARVPGLVTDGAYLPDGRFVLRTYTSVFVYDRPGHQVARAELPLQPQGESVAADGDRLLVGSEGPESEVLAVPVPGGAKPAASGTSAPTALPAAKADDGGPAETWGLGAGVVVVLLAGVAVVLRRRRR
jgi:hypothetical protein